MPSIIQVHSGADSIRASIAPESIDESKRTFEIVWNTGAPSRRFGKMGELGYIEFDEILSTKSAHWDIERVRQGVCPLQNDHAGYYGPAGIQGQLGRVLSVTFGEECRAQVQFSSDPAHDGYWANIKSGVIRGVSPRYRVTKYRDMTKKGDAIRSFLAVEIELKEISLTPVPEDPGAGIRSSNNHATYSAEVELGGRTTTMPDVKPVAAGDADAGANPGPTTTDGAPTDGARSASAGEPRRDDVATAVEIARVRAAERERVDGIRSAATQLRLTDPSSAELVKQLIDGETPLDQARSQLVYRRSVVDQTTLGPAVGSLRVGVEERDKVRSAMTDALLHRADFRQDGKPIELDDASRAFRGKGLIGIAEECIRRAGVNTSGMTRSEIADIACGGGDSVRSLGGMLSSSDFPHILSNLVNKFLMSAYAVRASSWKLLSRRRTTVDFKPLNLLRLGEMPRLKKVNEHGEFERGSVRESRESYAVEDYGAVVQLTRKTLINDDLAAFSSIPEGFGRQAVELEAQIMIGLLLANPLMADGQQVASAAHNNVIGGAGAGVLNETGLQNALLLLMKQTGLDGVTLVGNTPWALVVPAALQIPAARLVTQISPAQSSNVNPFVGMFQHVIVEPRLDVGADGQAGDAVKWWMAGDPSMVPMFEHAYMDGQEGVYTQVNEGTTVNGLQWVVRHTFGGAIADFRGLVRSTGL